MRSFWQPCPDAVHSSGSALVILNRLTERDVCVRFSERGCGERPQEIAATPAAQQQERRGHARRLPGQRWRCGRSPSLPGVSIGASALRGHKLSLLVLSSNTILHKLDFRSLPQLQFDLVVTGAFALSVVFAVSEFFGCIWCRRDEMAFYLACGAAVFTLYVSQISHHAQICAFGAARHTDSFPAVFASILLNPSAQVGGIRLPRHLGHF